MFYLTWQVSKNKFLFTKTAYPCQLCAALLDSQSRPVVIQPGIKPGSVVMALALSCSALDRCATREPTNNRQVKEVFRCWRLRQVALYEMAWYIICLKSQNLQGIRTIINKYVSLSQRHYLFNYHDFYRSRYLSLFGQCSALDVAGLLAITDPFSICFVLFSHTPGFNSLIKCCVFNPLFPPCLCAVLFVCLTVARRVIVPIFCISYGFYY
jgi:hypothetical protein